MIFRALAASLALALSSSPGIAQGSATLWRVSDDGELFQALQSSVSGDTILLADGGYNPSVTISGKSLTLIGNGPATRLLNGFSVSDLSESQRVAFVNLELLSPFYGADRRLTNNAGQVLFSGVRTEGGPKVLGPTTPGQFIITDSSDVVFERSAIEGTAALDSVFGSTLSPAEGMRVIDSTVWLYDSTVDGGGTSTLLIPGQDALQTSGDVHLRIVRSTLRGSDANLGSWGDGGNGIEVLDGNLSLRSQDTTLLGGSAGAANPPGAPGVGLNDNGLPASELPFLAPIARLELPFSVNTGATLSVELESEPNRVALAGFGFASSPSSALPLPVHLGLPLQLLVLGTTTGRGTLQTSFTLASFTPGVDVASVLVQAYTVDPVSTSASTSNPAALVILRP